MDGEAHARLSASASERWLNCPASVQFVEGLVEAGTVPADTSSEYADQGTFAHAILAQVLEGEVSLDRIEGLESPDGRFTVDAEMHAAIADAHGYVLRHLRDDDMLFVERRVSYSKWVHEGWGTADAVIVGSDRIEILDFKYGQGVYVPVEDNPQFKLYGLGAAAEFDMLLDEPLREVVTHVVQPRRDNMRSHSYEAEELYRWGEDVVAPVAADIYTGRAASDFVPGDAQCRWCPAKAHCPTLSNRVLEKAVEGFEPVEDDTPIDAEELGELLEMSSLVQTWLAGLTERAHSIIEDGGTVPGWKMVRATSHRVWGDEQKAIGVLRRAGVKANDYYRKKLVTPAQAEKLVGKTKKSLLGKYINKPPGKPKLVPEDDPAEAIDFNPAKGFGEVAE